MIAFWGFTALFTVAFGALIWHLSQPPEYRPPVRRMYRKTSRARRITWRRPAGLWARLHPAPLPRRRVRDLVPNELAGLPVISYAPAPLPDEDAATLAWARGLNHLRHPCDGWLRLTAASIVWQAITHHLAPAAIPPTETPELDYGDTSADWADIRKELFAMLAEDVTP